MELTKQDKKHIAQCVDRLTYRIVVESQEYAQLYEYSYLDALIKRLEIRRDALNLYKEQSLKVSEPLKEINNETNNSI